MKAFENDTFLRTQIHNLIVTYGVRSVIETGTEYGGTANAFAEMVQAVVTIDVTKKCELSHLYPNVIFIEGDSRSKLREAISLIPAELQPILFYLDAHTSDPLDECPLREELQKIQESKIKDPIIVIHDCHVPGHPELGYAVYNKQTISLEYVADLLPPLYTNGVEVRYNSEATGARQGCLFLLPAILPS